MTTSSTFKTEELKQMATPDEDVMLNREGFQTRSFRYELGDSLLPITPIGNDVREIETGDALYADPDGDMPLGPTGIGETGGSVGVVQTRGDKFELYRYAHSMHVMEEDEEVDADNVAEKRRQTMELFDIEMDKTIFDGVTDENGNTVRNDIFSEFKSGIPGARTIDCSTLGVDADLNGEIANLFREESYAKMEGHYFDGAWEALIAKHPVHAKFNRLDDKNDGLFTEWDTVISDGGVERVVDSEGLVNRRIKVPEYISLPSPDANNGPLGFNVSSLGADEALVLPSHNGDFVEHYEQGGPDVREPTKKSGWQYEVEYKMWGGHGFDVTAGNSGPRDDAGNRFPDAVHLTNVSSLF